ncbi:MAG: phage tail protein [Chitinophagaceae bacterium]|nr:MAG: phage tail protein [Chitinophagaceae bacterium]
MSWYRVGTVAITAGQTTVTGTGTNFPANSRVGDAFQGPDGRWYEVTNIASATVISILPAYLGATVAAGTYGLAPMQGYVKESADRLRQLVDQFGATLAGLGAVSTENVVPVAKGGTGGTTQALARNGLGLKLAAVADIVGPVSQSGGVPTGAIIEQATNANGSAIKYADGTMICYGRGSGTTGTDLVNQYGAGGVTYAAVAVPFPAVFANNNYSFISKSTSRGMVELSVSRTNSGCSVQVRHASASQIVDFDYIVIGRWF